MSQPALKKAKYSQKYLKKYDSISGIKSAQKGDGYAYCTYSRKDFSIGVLPAVACMILADIKVDQMIQIYLLMFINLKGCFSKYYVMYFFSLNKDSY